MMRILLTQNERDEWISNVSIGDISTDVDFVHLSRRKLNIRIILYLYLRIKVLPNTAKKLNSAGSKIGNYYCLNELLR